MTTSRNVPTNLVCPVKVVFRGMAVTRHFVAWKSDTTARLIAGNAELHSELPSTGRELHQDSYTQILTHSNYKKESTNIKVSLLEL